MMAGGKRKPGRDSQRAAIAKVAARYSPRELRRVLAGRLPSDASGDSPEEKLEDSLEGLKDDEFTIPEEKK